MSVMGMSSRTGVLDDVLGIHLHALHHIHDQAHAVHQSERGGYLIDKVNVTWGVE